jgi:glycosyltransferase involved in cell wall biosynthesis
MNHGRRARVPFPETYKNFRLIRTHGRVFGIPNAAGFCDVGETDATLVEAGAFLHPAVISAANLAEIQEMIDGFDESTVVPETIGAIEGYNLVRLGEKLYGVPKSAPAGDLFLADERARLGAIPVQNEDELRRVVERTKASVPVEFAGWLPIYAISGNCGQHPQFKHTNEPPPGYRFTCSAQAPNKKSPRKSRFVAWLGKLIGGMLGAFIMVFRLLFAFVRPRRGVTIRARVRVFAAMMRLSCMLLWNGCKPLPILRFLSSRHLNSQLLVGDKRELVFLTSMPYTYGQNPWVIEIEDPTTLFYPMVHNGHTCNLTMTDLPYFRIVKLLLEADHCKAILTHMKSTAELVATLFNSEKIRNKIVYAPLGVKAPARWQRQLPQKDDEPIHLLFINSWCQAPTNFNLRGGLEILEAFDTLRIRYPQLRLTMRTNLPGLDDYYRRIIERGWVRLIDRFTTAEEMADLHAESHIFLLPAARVHIVSLLQAMSYGLAVVASDGWGIDEYLEHERNGLIVNGRYGHVSWADREAGLLREDYDVMHIPNPQIVEGLIESISRLVEDPQLRARLGRTARADVEDRFNMTNWNLGLKKAFDMAGGGTSSALAASREADERDPVDAESLQCRNHVAVRE